MMPIIMYGLTCTERCFQVGDEWGRTSAQVGPEWAEFVLQNATMWSHNLWLNFSTPARLGTRVWVDGVALTMSNRSAPAAPAGAMADLLGMP